MTSKRVNVQTRKEAISAHHAGHTPYCDGLRLEVEKVARWGYKSGRGSVFYRIRAYEETSGHKPAPLPKALKARG